ncbi:Pectinesterase A [Clarias magur]|uniref:Pectinesterase A n=1 Tax=Clarias magur TaxID=1594786 RepID=A0A8J4X6B5_CLAMG|nr:Pectinesterase A [Clarias magur]
MGHSVIPRTLGSSRDQTLPNPGIPMFQNTGDVRAPSQNRNLLFAPCNPLERYGQVSSTGSYKSNTMTGGVAGGFNTELIYLAAAGMF